MWFHCNPLAFLGTVSLYTHITHWFQCTHQRFVPIIKWLSQFFKDPQKKPLMVSMYPPAFFFGFMKSVLPPTQWILNGLHLILINRVPFVHWKGNCWKDFLVHSLYLLLKISWKFLNPFPSQPTVFRDSLIILLTCSS